LFQKKSNIIFWFLCLCLPGVGFSQEDSMNIQVKESVYLKKVEGELDPSDSKFLVFPNIKKVEYYKDDKMLNRIRNAEKDKNYPALDSLLGIYISKFGIRNFKQDVDIIWKAGQLRELFGDTAGALVYFNLAVKNQSRFYKQIKMHCDSMVSKTKNEFVDLEYYYKILEKRKKIDPIVPPKGVLLNMGKRINSPYPDYAPYMHPSDSILIFTSRRGSLASVSGYDFEQPEDIYFTKREWTSYGWKQAEKFSNKINTELNEGSACLSPDGKTLYFTRCNDPQGHGVCDIYTAKWNGKEWTDIENMGTNINSADWDSQPSISEDGTLLFFTSNRGLGFGRADIFVSRKNPDLGWSKAENLGPVINTIEEEVTPFYHSINKTLYFSSMGHLNSMGTYDIYKSRWLEDRWEEPKNIGPLVNTPGSEYYFTIDSKGQNLFYAMARTDENKPEVRLDFDLYSFPMPMGARPDAVVTLKGFLVDSVSGNPLQGIVMVIDLDKNVEVEPKYINKYGYFEFELINNNRYQILIQGDNIFTIRENISLERDTSFSILTKSIDMKKPIVFDAFEFQENSSDLNETIAPTLDYISRFMLKYPMYNIKISGHTSSDGDANYNMVLSEKRAFKIYKYLIVKGVPQSRVEAEGFGESKPIVPNDSPANKKKNRRVEFELVMDPNYRGDPVILPEDDEVFINNDEIEERYETNEFDEAFDWEGEEEDFILKAMDDELEEYDDIKQSDIENRKEKELEKDKFVPDDGPEIVEPDEN